MTYKIIGGERELYVKVRIRVDPLIELNVLRLTLMTMERVNHNG
jgi:hypothetical protein